MDIVLKRIIEKEEKGKELYRILWSKNILQKYTTMDHMLHNSLQIHAFLINVLSNQTYRKYRF